MSEGAPLAAGLRRGDRAAFEQVYREQVGAVMRTLRAGFAYVSADGERRFLRVASAFDAEELCQEAFVGFFRACREGRFDVERPARPYLRRIAMNLALRQAGKRYREVLVEEPERAGAGAPPEAAAERAELARLLGELRDGLEPREQGVLDAWSQDTGSQQAIAARLGLSRDQVYRSMVRIRKRALRLFRSTGWWHGA